MAKICRILLWRVGRSRHGPACSAVQVTPGGLGKWHVVGATPAAATAVLGGEDSGEAPVRGCLPSGGVPFLEIFRASGGVAVRLIAFTYALLML